ncbi:MAG: tetratricopeptide repeat protein, partial [Actinocatenispora sp.]
AWTVRHLVDRLRDRHRLTELSAGDRSLGAAFTLSYDSLTPDQRRLFRRLGLYPGHDLDEYAAAALNGSDVATAERLLEHLVDVHLLQQCVLGRYSMHDLLREHATATVEAAEPEAVRRSAVGRVLGHYVYTARRAAGCLSHAVATEPLGTEPGELPDLDTAAEAIAWCEVERANLTAIITHAARHDWHLYAWQLAHQTRWFFRARGYMTEAIGIHRIALEAARQRDDDRAAAEARVDLSNAHQRLGEYATAADHSGRAAELFRKVGDVAGEGLARYRLGVSHYCLDRYPQARHEFERALELARAAGDARVEVLALASLAVALSRLGRRAEALDLCELVLRLHQSSPVAECYALDVVGSLYTRAGRHTEALECLHRAQWLAQQSGDRHGEANILAHIGMAQQSLGRYADALVQHERALALARRVQDTGTETEILINMGDASLGLGRSDAARDHYRRAIAIAVPLRYRYLEAYAYRRLGEALGPGNPRAAGQYQERARVLFAELGVTEPDRALPPDMDATG